MGRWNFRPEQIVDQIADDQRQHEVEAAPLARAADAARHDAMPGATEQLMQEDVGEQRADADA